MNQATSKDGTTIAFDQAGQGPALIMVGGALGARSHPRVRQMTSLLAPHFTVLAYDRRGRGDSGDTAPYAVSREIEDIEALIDEAGGAAFVYGVSSGAVLALEAANRLANKVKKLALYEPPLIVDDSRPPAPVDYVDRLEQAMANGGPGDALEVFMTDALRVPAEALAAMQQDPSWAAMKKTANTLAYDGRVMEGLMLGEPLPPGKWDAVTIPTLVITGGESEPFFHSGAKALVSTLPDAEHYVLDGQSHDVSPDALAPVLVEFFEE